MYLLDEDWITIAGKRWYRVTVFDALMKAPFLEGLTDTSTNVAIKNVIEPVLRDKALLTMKTDGRAGSATLVEDEFGALHYRCGFHKASNLREALWESLDDDDLTAVEQIAARRICSEVCALLTDHTRSAGLGHYTRMRDRFEAVHDEIEEVPEPLQQQIRSIEAPYDKFTAYHREPWLPGTINELENYFRTPSPLGSSTVSRCRNACLRFWPSR
ncbi:hypothetical protein BRC85_06485 [Halobacteriales archaeon QS_1_69_70]|nr:MAG: hypothetical protein BRC85_06485 [Halobacteriales archaeon QS_1_69_70]